MNILEQQQEDQVIRREIRFPFAIDAASGQAAQTDYASHVDQMIRQVLLTNPGERVCLPSFGAGLRRLLFAPMNTSLGATTKLIGRSDHGERRNRADAGRLHWRGHCGSAAAR